MNLLTEIIDLTGYHPSREFTGLIVLSSDYPFTPSSVGHSKKPAASPGQTSTITIGDDPPGANTKNTNAFFSQSAEVNFLAPCIIAQFP
jgi:hypothetical protein